MRNGKPSAVRVDALCCFAVVCFKRKPVLAPVENAAAIVPSVPSFSLELSNKQTASEADRAVSDDDFSFVLSRSLLKMSFGDRSGDDRDVRLGLRTSIDNHETVGKPVVALQLTNLSRSHTRLPFSTSEVLNRARQFDVVGFRLVHVSMPIVSWLSL